MSTSTFEDGAVIELAAPIHRVTVLEDRAQVDRRGRVTLPAGRLRLRVRELAPVLVDRTVRACLKSVDGSALHNVQDLRVRRAYRSLAGRSELPSGALQEEATALEKERVFLKRRREILIRQKKLAEDVAQQALADLGTDVAWGSDDASAWRERLDALYAKEKTLAEQKVENDTAEEILKEKIADLKRRRAAAESPSETLSADAELALELDEPGEFEVEVSYLVPAACWRPSHRARLELGDSQAGAGQPGAVHTGAVHTGAVPTGAVPTGDGQAGRVYFEAEACVWQNTGEDWNDVELRFSTQRPTQGHSPPQLEEDFLKARPKPERVSLEAREVEIQHTGPESAGPTAKVAAELPGIDDGGSVLLLGAAHAASIPSDGRPYRVSLWSFETEAEHRLVAVPELQAAVLQKVTLTHAGSQPILAGPVDLIAHCGPIGRGRVLFVAPGARFDLGFGPDPTLRVHRETQKHELKASKLSRFVETKFLTNLQFSNLGTEPRTFEVQERIPVSEVEQARIVLHSGGTRPQAQADENGFIRRRVHLEGGAGATLKLAYSLQKRKDTVPD